MRKIIFLQGILLSILLALLLLFINVLVDVKVKLDKSLGNPLFTNHKVVTPEETSLPSYVGEKITYDVKFSKVYLGKAYFTNVADVQKDGRVLNLMTVETRLPRFTDTEKIYSDPKTLLPVRVERDVLNWPIREKIIEEYDQANYTVTIRKKKWGKEEKQVIKKDDHIHNSILLPFFVRRTPRLDIGRIIVANLPTRRLEIKLIAKEEVKVPAGTFQAYHFQSTPKQIDIWVSADERRIPVKVQGSGLLGYTLLMKEYNF